MKKVIIPVSELAELSRQELLEQINNGNVSLLKSIGAGELYDEMAKPGAFCRFLVKYICGNKDREEIRKRTVRILSFFAPSNLLRAYYRNSGCVVIGFNHPSLGEIFRLLYRGIRAFPDRDFLFPVNIPWYETITPVIPYLKRAGITVTPIITPKTESKLLRMFEGDEEKLRYIEHFKIAFERRYMTEVKECADKKGIIVVAPSATRQAGVFPDDMARRGEGHIHPTMTLIAHRICRTPDADVVFLPVTIFEPVLNNKKFNLFKIYNIYPCEPFEAAEVYEMSSGHSRDLDYQFLKRIDEVYSKRQELVKSLI